MGHYAKVIDGVVTQVIVAEPEFFDTYVDTSAGKWVQTSYNTRGGVHYDTVTGLPSTDQSKALRMNYAGVGFVYDERLDAFYPKQPFPSWYLNEAACMWTPPKPYPTDGKFYEWDESLVDWREVLGTSEQTP